MHLYNHKFYVTICKMTMKAIKKAECNVLLSLFCSTLWRSFLTTLVTPCPNWLEKKYGGSMTHLLVRYTQWFTPRAHTNNGIMHINTMKLVYYMYYAV